MTVSPGAVVVLALACLFGPLGPLAAEAIAAGVNLARRKPVVGAAFDFGALALAGAAAAAVFAALPTVQPAVLAAVGLAAGAVYYVVNAALLATVMGLSEGKAPIEPWRERLAWLWPHYLAVGVLAALFVAAERSLGLAAFIFAALPVTMLLVGEKQYVDRSRESVERLRGSWSRRRTSSSASAAPTCG